MVTHVMLHAIPENIQKSNYPALHDLVSGPRNYFQDLAEIVMCGGVGFVVWQIFYHLCITEGRKEGIKAGRETSFTRLKRTSNASFPGTMVLSFPEEQQQFIYMLVHFAIVILSMLPIPLLLRPFWSSVFLLIVWGISIHSGGMNYGSFRKGT